eukprot:7384473-Prymnesium_polylepis.2
MLRDPSRRSRSSASPLTPVVEILFRGSCDADMNWTTWRPACCSCDVASACLIVDRSWSLNVVPMGASPSLSRVDSFPPRSSSSPESRINSRCISRSTPPLGPAPLGPAPPSSDSPSSRSSSAASSSSDSVEYTAASITASTTSRVDWASEESPTTDRSLERRC